MPSPPGAPAALHSLTPEDSQTSSCGKDLVELEAAAGPGGRPAFLAALRWALGQVNQAPDQGAGPRAEVVRLMGSELAARVVLQNLTAQCGLPVRVVPRNAGRGDRPPALGDDLGQFRYPVDLMGSSRKNSLTRAVAPDALKRPPAVAILRRRRRLRRQADLFSRA